LAERPLVFDLDGTLVDARLRQLGVAAEVLGELELGELDARRFWRAKRAGATTAGALLALGYDPARAPAIADCWRDRVESERWLARDRALPGVARVLRRLRREGHTIAVLTARGRRHGAVQSLQASGLASLVDELMVVDPASAVTAKANVLAVCGARSFVGDAETDGDAAAVAAVAFVAVATGQRSAAYLRRRGYEPARSLRSAVDRLGL
jgi:phosphoglycolate phosphatase-like HAD superfamily hydrolase